MNDVPTPPESFGVPSDSAPSDKPKKIVVVLNQRRSRDNDGGTKGQTERLNYLRAYFKELYYKGLKNPQLRFKGAEDLGVELEVDESTIRGDIKFLREREGWPIHPIRARGGYGLLEEVKALNGDEFTRGEYLALWLSVQSFEAWGGLPQQQKMPAILRKLKTSGASVDPQQLREMRQRITFKAGGFQAPVEQGIFDAVLQALLKKEELHFDYLSLDQRRAVAAAKGAQGKPSAKSKTVVVLGKPEARKVLPLHLLCWEYAWYLFAWDHARNDIRTFALGRMSNVALSGKAFEEAPVKFNLKKELERSFGVTRGGKAVDVHLRFEPNAVPLIIERLWHPTQEMIENEDGTLDLNMRVAIVPELVRWVLSWGDDCQVLAPTALDDMVLEKHRRCWEKGAERRRTKNAGMAGSANVPISHS